MSWSYLPLLIENIKILLTIAIGVLMGYAGVFEAKVFVPQAVTFIFYVALPLHILRGIGIAVDFYDKDFLWSYIGAFLILRAIALIGAVGWVLFQARDGRHGLGLVAVIWLSLTWISTVILGIPIARAVFGDPMKGVLYGMLAGISSFIFQLPLQLLLLECHTLEQEYLASSRKSTDNDTSADLEADFQNVKLDESSEGSHNDDHSPDEQAKHSSAASFERKQPGQMHEDEELVPLFLWVKFARRADVWCKIVTKVLHNPVIWGIAGGFVLSLSTIGPTYLNPKSPDYIEGLGWIWLTTEWFGECVSPVSLFTMGLWMQDQGKKLFVIPAHQAFLFMLSKLVIVPLVMVGLAKAINLNNEAGRAAVLIASLPISMASFSFGSKYQIGEDILSANVALGTLLLMSTVAWNVVMDEIGLFPI